METPVSEGDVLETVLLGLLLDGNLRLWRSNGIAETVRVAEAQQFADLLGRGIAARTSPEPRRYREVAFLNEDRRTLLVMGRPQAGNDPITAAGAGFTVEWCDEPPPTKQLWMAAVEYLGVAVVDAVRRGEFVVVETGGWDAVPSPYAMTITTRLEDGTWLSQIEAQPAPRSPSWPEPSADQPGSTLSARQPAPKRCRSQVGCLPRPCRCGPGHRSTWL